MATATGRLVLSVDKGRVRFIPGDLLGLITADFLGARHAAVPVSVNDAVDTFCAQRGITLVKTRIGSPYVVAAMTEVGWKAMRIPHPDSPFGSRWRDDRPA